MCCRYYIERENNVLSQFGDAALHTPLHGRFLESLSRPILTFGEIRPDNVVPVIATSKNRNRSCYPMQWGFHLQQRSLVVNARLETAAEKPLFQAAWRSHRCAIPASWYFEWEHFLRPNGKKETGNQYLIQPRDGSLLWFCGLYRMEEGLPRFVILTRPPNAELGAIHDRMPLIIREQDVDAWIDPQSRPEEITYHAVTDLYYEKTGS